MNWLFIVISFKEGFKCRWFRGISWRKLREGGVNLYNVSEVLVLIMGSWYGYNCYGYDDLVCVV